MSPEDEVTTARCDLGVGKRDCETIFTVARRRKPAAWRMIAEPEGRHAATRGPNRRRRKNA